MTYTLQRNKLQLKKITQKKLQVGRKRKLDKTARNCEELRRTVENETVRNYPKLGT